MYDTSNFGKPKIAYPSPVEHQQTCPLCKRTLVNLYFQHEQWACKKCQKQFEKDVAYLKNFVKEVSNVRDC